MGWKEAIVTKYYITNDVSAQLFHVILQTTASKCKRNEKSGVGRKKSIVKEKTNAWFVMNAIRNVQMTNTSTVVFVISSWNKSSIVFNTLCAVSLFLFIIISLSHLVSITLYFTLHREIITLKPNYEQVFNL